ncbi:hypothetical protein OQJ18_01315 [Fluoribacter dumoffii]|uniref:Uncharacterized protein n=1 Tax=Fluoribacter dumoffii TaxID=463 RepID=A0A377GBK6_9GAMM|nr:hypothetical protein [Fluoribacter dumoffii]KTC90513.1 hypothetical protein Ldum_1581 [Fluoribacter dumoffii NY 23]MCW8386192.1 hypothetical protein [Fluoribacter dumoffii]MCW8419243.1 hypothetical protein [Fluoribacter dumoffii]MCW8452882.1 hypothetical protein [Fluoribacter dumoffii]MCW8459868.1 hypothetical protein [Fluoribacter dumoffii]
MNKLLLAFFSLILFSASSYADKIVITGQPVILEKQGDVYYVPNDYKTTASYYYVTVEGAQRVCYIEKQPQLTALDTSTLEVNYNGSTLTWVCYPFDTNYFQTP